MLSLEQCREYIDKNKEFSDEQILEIKNALYEMAELALEVYLEEKK